MPGFALDIDRAIVQFDRMLRTLCAPPVSARPVPGQELTQPPLDECHRRQAAALMRVNHTGEVCAQALYQGQALTARNESVRTVMEQASREESEHLAWTALRIDELGGRTSLLNPLFYVGALLMGAAAGRMGDPWSLGFLQETERQVEGHLQAHLAALPETDHKSRAIVEQMKQDEARHASTAQAHGAAELPGPVRHAMRAASKFMTGSTYWI
jgi:ubiquinone biosynthesis monooxygenase Coq7